MAPSHPLRRLSTGSLSSLHRSQDRHHSSPSGLDFLSPAFQALNDEAAMLEKNVQQLNELHDALGTFNESFAGWLYALKMNAFCVEWPQAPNEISFSRLQALAPEPPAPAPPLSPPSAPSTMGQSLHADMSYATQRTAQPDDSPPPARKVAAKKPAAGPSVAAKKAAMAARKKREAEISSIIETLPLEFRGSQPSQRLAMEKIIDKLMKAGQATNLVSPPDLPQPRVNKCLIALVQKKLVNRVKDDEASLADRRWAGNDQADHQGKTAYQWIGP